MKKSRILKALLSCMTALLLTASCVTAAPKKQTAASKPAETEKKEMTAEDIEKQIAELESQKKALEKARLEEQRQMLAKQKDELDARQRQLDEQQKSLRQQPAAPAAGSAAPGAPSAAVSGKIVYVSDPEVVYSDDTKNSGSTKVLTGTDALVQNLKDTTILPEYEQGKLKAFLYQRQRIYQVHAQTYHTTVIQLEPGESLLEVPYLSEAEVWKLSRGTGILDGKETQYLMLKPDYANLDSTMVIITDRRMYQLQIKSYKNHYMPYVSWVYNDRPPSLPAEDWTSSSGLTSGGGGKPTELQDIIASSPNLSFDYTWRFSGGEKPYWCPTAVYDDGQSTYIVLDETCLNMEFPAVFRNAKDIVNFDVSRNVITVHGLQNKLTLKLGSQKVTIEKQKSKL